MSTLLISGSIYDYPSYYDVLFSASWKEEFAFLCQQFAQQKSQPVRRVFEPGSGTGRLLWRLAQAGYDVSGLDINPKTVDYCNRRMKRHGLQPTAKWGDMTVDLQQKEPVDAAYNLVSSFCHLTEKGAAERHLMLMSEVLREEGLYILGLHLKPQGQGECDEEHWTVRRGRLKLSSELRIVESDPRRNRETLEFRICAETPGRTVLLSDRFPFRTYTKRQFQDLLRTVNQFEIDAVYNFSFQPIVLDSQSEDVIFVLKKKRRHVV
ncbi:MAG: class I SAM-dependent methyltransferase [Thermoguttaceae bacterium]